MISTRHCERECGGCEERPVVRIGVEIIDKTLIRCAHWFAEATTITERSLGGQETGFEEQRGRGVGATEEESSHVPAARR